MPVPKRIGLLIVAAAWCGACGDVMPSPPSLSASVSPAPTVSAPPLPVEPSARATTPAASPPEATPSGSPSITPPYRVRLGDEEIVQQPGTIIFGSLPLGLGSDGFLEPYLTWPDGGLTIDAEVAFGAFWGQPLGASEIRITLYRVSGGTLRLVWSDTKPVAPEAIGYLDELVPFKAPGTYRLEVTRGSTLLAWGLAHMGPRCETNCSGG